MEIRWAGLGRHTLKAGGPVGPNEIYKFFKVKILGLTCSRDLLTPILAVSRHSSHVLCFSRGHQDVPDPSLLPHFWSHTMVPMASGSHVVNRRTLLRRLCACRCLRM